MQVFLSTALCWITLAHHHQDPVPGLASMSQQKQDRASQVASALGMTSAKKQKTLQFTSVSPEAKQAKDKELHDNGVNYNYLMRLRLRTKI